VEIDIYKEVARMRPGPYADKKEDGSMQLSINGKGMEISEYLRNIVEKKARKFDRYFKEDTSVIVTLSIEKSRHIAEVTVPFFDGTLLRAEESSGDMYNSIDTALKKLERKMHKHRERLGKRLHEKAYDVVEAVYDEEEVLPEGKLVRRKNFPIKPMDVEEAQYQMELLGHSFFVFVAADTGEVNVLYKRKDGDYGLLEPEYK
jgi:putative sigma-54 modulation protein